MVSQHCVRMLVRGDHGSVVPSVNTIYIAHKVFNYLFIQCSLISFVHFMLNLFSSYFIHNALPTFCFHRSPRYLNPYFWRHAQYHMKSPFFYKCSPNIVFITPSDLMLTLSFLLPSCFSLSNPLRDDYFFCSLLCRFLFPL